MNNEIPPLYIYRDFYREVNWIKREFDNLTLTEISKSLSYISFDFLCLLYLRETDNDMIEEIKELDRMISKRFGKGTKYLIGRLTFYDFMLIFD